MTVIQTHENTRDRQRQFLLFEGIDSREGRTTQIAVPARRYFTMLPELRFAAVRPAAYLVNPS